MDRENILKRIRLLLANILPKGATAFIFGSQARGDYSQNSDWDLLILLNQNTNLDPKSKGTLALPIYMLGAELDIDINPVLYTNSEWEKRNFTPFYKNVITDRVKIWG